MTSTTPPESTGTGSALRTWLLVFCSLAMMATLSYPLIANEVFLEDDISSTYLPLRYFYQQCLQQGESFLWIPNIFKGFYLHGESQNGMYHPLHLLLYRFLPLTYALDLELLISYPFMFAGMILFLRRLRVPFESVVFGALLFTFSGYCISRWLWFVHMGVLSHTPWLLYCIHVALRSSDRTRVSIASLGVVLFTTSELLVGYPQMVYVTGLVEGLYALFLLPAAPLRRVIVVLLGAKFIAAACAAIQLIPTFDLVSHSARAATDYGFRMAGSQHPINLIQLVNPYFFHQRMVGGHGYETMYGGAVMSVFALWMLVRFRKLSVSKPIVVFCGICIVLGAVLTMGHYAFLYRWLAELPILNSFRGTPRHWAMFHVGWVLLSVLAYTELLTMRENKERSPWKELFPLFVLPVMSVGLLLFVVSIRIFPDALSKFADLEEKIAPTRNVLISAVIMAGAAGLVIYAARGWRYGLLAILIFTAADISLYGLRHKTSGNLEEFIESIDTPPGPPDFRFEPNYHPVYSVNGPLMKGYSTPGGILSIPRTTQLDYFLNPIPLRLAGTKWVRTRRGAGEDLEKALDAGIEWIELDNPMPRARLVSETLVSSNPAADIQIIDISVTALVEPGVVVDAGPPGDALVILDRPGRIHVRTEAPTRQLLVLTEAYDDEWKLLIDEQSAPVVPAYGDLLAAVVEAGNHELRFQFDPRSFRIGRIVSILGLLIAVVWHLTLPFLLPLESPKPTKEKT